MRSVSKTLVTFQEPWGFTKNSIFSLTNIAILLYLTEHKWLEYLQQESACNQAHILMIRWTSPGNLIKQGSLSRINSIQLVASKALYSIKNGKISFTSSQKNCKVVFHGTILEFGSGVQDNLKSASCLVLKMMIQSLLQEHFQIFRLNLFPLITSNCQYSLR